MSACPLRPPLSFTATMSSFYFFKLRLLHPCAIAPQPPPTRPPSPTTHEVIHSSATITPHYSLRLHSRCVHPYVQCLGHARSFSWVSKARAFALARRLGGYISSKTTTTSSSSCGTIGLSALLPLLVSSSSSSSSSAVNIITRHIHNLHLHPPPPPMFSQLKEATPPFPHPLNTTPNSSNTSRSNA